MRTRLFADISLERIDVILHRRKEGVVSGLQGVSPARAG